MAKAEGGDVTVLGLTCLRNEAPYIVDWVAHHLALGMDHMLVLTHDCDDGSDLLLDALAEEGRVTHVRFTPEGPKTVQWQALQILDRHDALKRCDWAMFFDVDEYLNLPEGMDDLGDMLRICDGTDAIAIPWRLFGSAGEEAFADRPVTERFTKSAPADLHYPLAHLFKTLHRPSAMQKLGVHRPRHRKGQVPSWRLANGTPMTPNVATNDKAITLYGQPGLARGGMPVLNHYSVRSAQEFVLKRQRGLPNHADRDIDVNYWAERNWTTVEDRSIQRFADRVALVKAGLMAVPGVADAHAAGVAWHFSKIEEAMQNIDTIRFVWRLGLLAGSTPPPVARTRAFIDAQMKARASDA